MNQITSHTNRDPSQGGRVARGLALAAFAVCSVVLFLLFFLQCYYCDDHLYMCFLWTAGFYNYIFPFLLLAGTLLLLRRLRHSERLRWYGAPALFLMALCGGYSTELYGLLCCALLGWTLLWGLIRREKRLWLVVLALVAAAGGLVLIFLSPATTGRANREVQFGWAFLLDNLKAQGALFRESVNLPLMLIGLQGGLALFGSRKRKLLPGWLCAVGALLPALLYLLPEESAGFLCYPALLALLLAEALLLTLRREDGLGRLLLAIPLTPLIMLFTQSIGPRFLGVVSLLVLLIIAACMERSGLHFRHRLALVLLLTAAALAVTLPSIPVRLHNYRVERENEANADRAASTGVMEIRMDYDLRMLNLHPFADSLMIWYYQHHGVIPEQTSFHMIGNTTPTIFLDGKQVDGSVILGNITTFYQLSGIADKMGAVFECPQPDEYRITWNGVTVSVVCDRDSTHYHNAEVCWTDPDGTTNQFKTHVKYMMVVPEEPFCDEEFFRRIWNLQFDHQGDRILVTTQP